jgi:transcriptional regulator with XRE-family HTH domain
MANSEEIQSLIAQLQETPNAGRANFNVPEVLAKAMQELDLKPSQLAVALDVSQASVSRWMSGGNSPHLRHLRAIENLLRSRTAVPPEKDGVEFRGRKLGIYGVDGFFHRARQAKNLFILKKSLGFQAGMNSAVHQQLREVFVANPSVKIFYAFPRDSEPAMTFLNLRRELAPEFPNNIYWKEFEPDQELMKLFGEMQASCFILENPDGSIDIMLEVPVRTLTPIDEFDLATFTTVFLEMSDSHKYRMWVQWRGALEKIEWDSMSDVEAKAG